MQENPEYICRADNQGGRFIVDRASRDIEVCNQSRYTRFKAGHPAGFIEAFANYYYDIADSVNTYINKGLHLKNPYVFGIQETLEGMRLFDAIADSSESGKWIDLK
jgi:predicted dehydrogenase